MMCIRISAEMICFELSQYNCILGEKIVCFFAFWELVLVFLVSEVS